MDARTLVINADDLGFSADINAAIEEGHKAGRITNASLMVDGNEVADALKVIRRNPQLGVGLHLDLCTVIGFYNLPYTMMRDNLRSPEMLRRVGYEVERQLTAFKKFGLEFTHLDSHRHFHALPEVFSAVVEVAVAYGLRTIRLTKDWILPKTPSVYWDEAFFRSAITLLERHGILYPHKFIYGAHEYSAADFTPGLTELMVHVAYQDEYFLREYRRLSSAELWQGIRELGIQVRSYRDLTLEAG